VFGLSRPSEMLTGTNVALLERAVRERAKELATGAGTLPGQLTVAAAKLRIPSDDQAGWPRRNAALLADRLVRAVQSADGGKALVQALARAEVGPSQPVLFRSLSTATMVSDRLGRVNWESFEGLDGLGDTRGQ